MSVTKPKILVVDDEAQVRSLLRKCFEKESYTVIEAANCEMTLQAVNEQDIDLITLDVNLDGEDGLGLASRIRAVSSVPIIMVSGKGELIDTVVGLEVGADDYISKPFELREVVARVKSALRRSQLSKQNAPMRHSAELATTNVSQLKAGSGRQYRFSGCVLCSKTRDLKNTEGRNCNLTSAEFNLLEVLVSHAHQVLSRDQIMDSVKGMDWNPNDRTIDNQIARLRKKLDGMGIENAIRTVRGSGYQFTPDVKTGETTPV